MRWLADTLKFAAATVLVVAGTLLGIWIVAVLVLRVFS